jgi:hypothetical protein
MTTETYIVSADHPNEDYRLDHKPVRVTEVTVGSLVRYIAHYGPNRTSNHHRSHLDAIMSLLTENGCTNVYIHRRAPKEANDSGVLPEDVLGVVQNRLEQLEKK